MFRIKREVVPVTIPADNDTAFSADAVNLNGLVRAITVVAPDLDGDDYTLSILGSRGEVLFSKASLVKDTTTVITVDANNHPLRIPVSLNTAPAVKIKTTGTDDATGALTIVADSSSIADGDTVTINGPTDSRTYRFKNTTAAINDIKIVPHVKSTGTITATTNGIPTEDETIVIGAVTYRFRDTLAQINDVKIGADGEATLNNLRAAINLTGTEGVEYFAGQEIHPTVSAPSAAAVDTDATLGLEAKTAGAAGNSLTFTESASNITISGAGTLTGGSDQGFETLENLKLAIGASGSGDGSDYHAGTTAHGDVTAARTNGVLTVTAKEPVESGEDVTTTEASSVLSWAAPTLVNGGETVDRVFAVDLYMDQ